jgi:four helix bundle protein
MPRGHAELSDQLRRATLSIPLNIAEVAPGKAWEEEA